MGYGAGSSELGSGSAGEPSSSDGGARLDKVESTEHGAVTEEVKLTTVLASETDLGTELTSSTEPEIAGKSLIQPLPKTWVNAVTPRDLNEQIPRPA